MKTIVLALLAMGITMTGFAQTDTTGVPKDTTAKQPGTADTIKVGGMIIVRTPGEDGDNKLKNIQISNNKKNKNANVRTNWWIVDLGFSNWKDNTDYTSAEAQAFAPGINEDHLDLRDGKSVNVNIWVFQQKLNLIKHVVNLKYGLGVELNNYRFEDKRVKFTENPTNIVLNEEWKDIKKNKLAADYLTVPLMLNFNFTPKRESGFGFSAGVSAGYLYSARQKIKEDGDKDKFKDDFELNKFKLSYIGELSLGYVKLYGSYAMDNMWDKGLDMQPYTVGLRLSKF